MGETRKTREVLVHINVEVDASLSDDEARWEAAEVVLLAGRDELERLIVLVDPQ